MLRLQLTIFWFNTRHNFCTLGLSNLFKIFLTFLILSWISNYYSTSRLHNLIQKKLEGGASPLRIVIWGPPYAGDWLAFPKEGYRGRGCPCYFTRDMTQADTADAITYHAIDKSMKGNYSKLPPWSQRTSSNPQLRVFVSLESPQLYSPTFRNLPNNDQFNWTVTYRLDSDVIYTYYGRAVKKEDSKLTGREIRKMSSHPPTLTVPPEKLQLLKDTYLPPNKTFIAWVVSHCKTNSKRLELVHKLRKHVTVDVYGKCETLKCPPKKCKKWIGQKYKFYLSFENSLCYDYITEKFFTALRNHMLPIVYGGANYSKFAPLGSFIDVQDFKNLRELAKYIKYLDRNDDEYLKYFLWKQDYFISFSQGFCTLCHKIYKISHVHKRKRILNTNYSKTIKNISHWLYFMPQVETSKGGLRGKPKLSCQFPPKTFE